MFNLLVKSSPWAPSHDQMLEGRVLQYTADHLLEHYAPEGKLRLDLLSRLPTVFAEETDRSGAVPLQQFARVGRIVDARPDTDGHITIEYILDPDVPPIPQRELIAMAPALGISLPTRGWTELGTTHWAVKDYDLFKTLFTAMRPAARIPQVFTLSDPPSVDGNQLSAMMPFAGFQFVYEAIIRAAVANGMKCNRADDFWEHHEIIQDIVTLIDRSAIVVCDCTTRNPNVFYEIGIAHSLGKEVILITRQPADVPFDLANLRHIRYLNNGEGLQKLERELTDRIRGLRAQQQLADLV